MSFLSTLVKIPKTAFYFNAFQFFVASFLPELTVIPFYSFSMLHYIIHLYSPEMVETHKIQKKTNLKIKASYLNFTLRLPL